MSAAVSFVLVAIFSGALITTSGSLLLWGLIFCAIGDSFLLGRGNWMFLAGMGAFAVGHVFYVIAFSILGGTAQWPIVLPLAVIVALTLKWLWSHLGAMRWPTVGYSLIIGLMVVLAVSAAGQGAAPALAALGAIGFAASDLSVAQDRFVRESFTTRAWGLPLYFMSQLLIAHSV